MTSQTDIERFDRRRAAVGALAVGVMAAVLMPALGAPRAGAQPSEPTTSVADAPTVEADGPRTPCTGDDCSDDEPTGEDAPAKMSADQSLSTIHEEYSQGEGGGQISKLIDDAMNLRRLGFRPSNANAAALTDALEDRPNQTPLVEALKETLAYQRKLQAQAQQAIVDNGPVAGPVPVFPGMTIPVG